ncbi:hypothetical protein G647_00290 [Cladophialophora carrionii CBS 160.54]|uniref:Phosphatidylglycerol/phosphatidylinositol transfer protein n=1 Tax=Cladophialophora carrionii CBS 160.54 TaxID=1279043 RepID=V9DMF4_9EURO|nr:uncharacterized protein G647_00290 [Cladophialophora carrionii CBS 160.54]ETI27841.1 hypothetical protein G647_00290 [Cladophialophora carrionii CBS 160.54]
MLILALITYLLTIVGAVPTTGIVIRNETSSPASDVLTFNMDPDVRPQCGYTEQVNINVKERGDAATTSDYCDLLYLYIVNTAPNGKTSKDVDLVFTCPGTPGPIDPEGYGYRDIKLILNAPSVDAFPRDQTRTAATLQLLNLHDGADITVPVEVGYYISSNSQLIWQYILCP